MANGKFSFMDDVFRTLLKQLREAKALTQSELAQRLGKPQSYVSKYETGERRLDFVETIQICNAVGIRVEEFVSAYLSKLSGFRQAKRR